MRIKRWESRLGNVLWDLTVGVGIVALLVGAGVVGSRLGPVSNRHVWLPPMVRQPPEEVEASLRRFGDSVMLRRATYRLPPSCGVVVLFDAPGAVGRCMEALRP